MIILVLYHIHLSRFQTTIGIWNSTAFSEMACNSFFRALPTSFPLSLDLSKAH